MNSRICTSEHGQLLLLLADLTHPSPHFLSLTISLAIKQCIPSLLFWYLSTMLPSSSILELEHERVVNAVNSLGQVDWSSVNRTSVLASIKELGTQYPLLPLAIVKWKLLEKFEFLSVCSCIWAATSIHSCGLWMVTPSIDMTKSPEDKKPERGDEEGTSRTYYNKMIIVQYLVHRTQQ